MHVESARDFLKGIFPHSESLPKIVTCSDFIPITLRTKDLQWIYFVIFRHLG